MPCVGSNVDRLILWAMRTVNMSSLRLQVAKTKGGKENKQLLNGISGYVAPRNMVAIMGPSGCGMLPSHYA